MNHHKSLDVHVKRACKLVWASFTEYAARFSLAWEQRVPASSFWLSDGRQFVDRFLYFVEGGANIAHK
jgi:hypothetical protein